MKSENTEYVSGHIYEAILNPFNYGFFKPKKDRYMKYFFSLIISHFQFRGIALKKNFGCEQSEKYKNLDE